MENLQVIEATWPIALLGAVFLSALVNAVFRADAGVRAEYALACAICFVGVAVDSLVTDFSAGEVVRHKPVVVVPAKTPEPSVNRAVADFIAAHFDQTKAKELANARPE